MSKRDKIQKESIRLQKESNKLSKKQIIIGVVSLCTVILIFLLPFLANNKSTEKSINHYYLSSNGDIYLQQTSDDSTPIAMNIQTREKNNDSNIVSFFCKELVRDGYNYLTRGKYDTAMYYFIVAAQQANKEEDYIREIMAVGNIGSIYLFKNIYDSALTYIDSALNLSVKYKYKIGEGIYLSNKGLYFKLLGDFDNALIYNDSALKIFYLIDYEIGPSTILFNNMEIYLSLGLLEKARNNLESLIKLNDKYSLSYNRDELKYRLDKIEKLIKQSNQDGN